ncbi:MAG TPA: DUF4232 domain-containing protein [Solirubrobacteraceae bacterium]|nr:DUF4232 domain-containing protein [Solirubrobacteraceae bacterium]
MRAQIRRPVRALTPVGLLVAPCLVVACGSGAPPPAPGGAGATVTRVVTRSATVSAPRTAGTAAAAATSSTPTTRSAAPQPAGERCVASGLALAFLGGNGATGHAELGFALRNASAHSCRTGGYPGVRFIGAAGRRLPTHPDHTTSDLFGRTRLRELTVAPGASVSFRLGVSHVGPGGSNTGCVRATAVQVIAPEDTARLTVAVRGGFAECAGVVSVSPLQPGRSAYP